MTDLVLVVVGEAPDYTLHAIAAFLSGAFAGLVVRRYRSRGSEFYLKRPSLREGSNPIERQRPKAKIDHESSDRWANLVLLEKILAGHQLVEEGDRLKR